MLLKQEASWVKDQQSFKSNLPLFLPVGSMPGLTAPPAACEVVSAVFGAPDGVRAVLPPAATPLQHKLPTVDTKPVLHAEIC